MNVSVLMCVYAGDNENEFNAALDSVIEQTMLPCEVIIVADGPLTQALDKLIEEYGFRFRLVGVCFSCHRLERNSGHGIARQHGLIQCRGEYVIICDADDINRADRFEKLISCLENDSSIDLIGSNILEIDSLSMEPLGVRVVEQDHSSIIKDLAIRCPFNQMSVAFRRAAVLSSGGYRDFYHNEDYSLWIRMFLNGCKFKNLNENLVYARVNTDFYGRRGGLKYFVSEFRIQQILLHNKITHPIQFCYNVVVRLLIQVVLPASVRSIVFKKFARSALKDKEA